MTASAEPGGQELTVIEGGAKRDAGVPFGHQPASAAKRDGTVPFAPAHIERYFVEQMQLLPAQQIRGLPLEARIEHLRTGARLELAGVLYQGFILLDLKADLPHGQFLAALSEAEMPYWRAKRLMRIARMFQATSDSAFSALRHASLTNLLLIASWPADEIERLAAGEEINGIALEDVRNATEVELEKRIKGADAATRHWRQKAQELDATLRAAYEELDRRKTADAWQGDLPGSVRQAREDGAALGLLATDCVTQMEALFAAVVSGADLNHDEHRRAGELRSGLGPLYVALRGISAQAVSLEQHMRELVPDYLPDSNEDLLLSDDEREAIVTKHRFLRTQLERVPSRLFGVGREEQIRESRGKKRTRNRGRRNG